jgi:hypothetical protein
MSNLVCPFCSSEACDEFHCPDCGYETSLSDDSAMSLADISASLYPSRGHFDLVELSKREFYSWRDSISAILRDVTLAADSFGRCLSALSARTNVDYFEVTV